MSEAIIASIISGIITLCGVFIANGRVIAVIQNEIEHIKTDVKNNKEAVTKIPEIQGDIRVLKEKQSVANHRLDDLERRLG